MAKRGRRTHTDGGFALSPMSFPQDTFLREYMELLTQVTEAPWIFHVMGGLAILGAVWGRRLSLPIADYRIYAPVHVLWVGPPGCGKTQAFNNVFTVVRSARPSIPAMKNETTRQGLIMTVGESAEFIEGRLEAGEVPEPMEFVFAAGEMSTIINKEKEKEGLVGMLIDMMDMPPQYDRTTRTWGREYVWQPTPSVLLCSTTASLLDDMPRNLFGGGFMSRLVPVVTKGKARVLPRPKLMDERERVRLGQRLWKHVSKLGTCKVELTGEEREWYEAWYVKAHSMQVTDERMFGWSARLHTHLLRFAMLLASNRWASGTDMKVEMQDLLLAERILGNVTPGVEQLMRLSSSTPFGALRQQVLSIVRFNGSHGTSRAMLLAQVPCAGDEMQRVLDALVEAEQVEFKPRGLGGRGSYVPVVERVVGGDDGQEDGVE